jgi:hypothetical protein
MDIPIPNAWPVGHKFLVYPDQPDEETESGVILTSRKPKFTGTVAKMPYDVQNINAKNGESTDIRTDGSTIHLGSRIQWSSQSGFAVPVVVEVYGKEVEFLLFSYKDVDLILPCGTD